MLSMKNTLIAMSCLVFAGMIACTSTPKRTLVGTTGTAGAGNTTGTAGAAAGSTGAGNAGAGGAGNMNGAAGDQGMAGSTSGTAGAGGGAAGDTGTAGAAPDAGMTADAGGTAGAGGAGGSTVPCTMGATGGAGGGTGSSCANTKWTFTPNNICANPPNAACGFCGNAMTGVCAPKNAIDGSLTTRYTSGEPQTGMENFVLSFASPVSITGIKIDSSGSPTDATTSYLAEYSLDGTTFQGWCPALTGPGGPNSVTDIVFPAAISVKAIRISQTGTTLDGSWWSIQEVTLDGCQ
jgi:F5/8 type C domain-containing protein